MGKTEQTLVTLGQTEQTLVTLGQTEQILVTLGQTEQTQDQPVIRPNRVNSGTDQMEQRD